LENNVKDKRMELLKDVDNILRYILDDYSGELIKNFIELRKWYKLSKYRETIFYGGRFAEAFIRGLAKKYGLDHKGQLWKIKNMLKSSLKGKINDFLREVYLEIAYNVYQLRSKKDVAHVVPGIDPSAFDAHFVYAACSAIFNELLSECIRLHKERIDIVAISKVLSSIIRKEIPFIEQINEGKILVYKGKTALEKVLFLLYYLNEWAHRDIIFKSLLHEKSKGAIIMALRNGIKKGLMVKSDDGMKYKITLKGIKYIEERMIKELINGITYV